MVIAAIQIVIKNLTKECAGVQKQQFNIKNMYKECNNCGCKVYNGACVNCDEEVFIMEQYYELDMPLPDEDSLFMKYYYKSINNPK